jgi:hypothetical protein
MRVYAMYPKTTSLYPATVIDNSTYCRGDDNIVVVEFDGDEGKFFILFFFKFLDFSYVTMYCGLIIK